MGAVGLRVVSCRENGNPGGSKELGGAREPLALSL